MDGGRRSESTGGSGNMEEVRQVRRGEVVNSFECKQEDLEFDTMFNGEPVKLLQDGCDVVDGGGSGDNAGS